MNVRERSTLEGKDARRPIRAELRGRESGAVGEGAHQEAMIEQQRILDIQARNETWHELPDK